MPHSPDHHFHPPQRVIVLRAPVACRNIYHNQNTIDGLNAILAGCDKLKTDAKFSCNAEFITTVENELLKQLSLARLVGRSCNQATLY